MNARRLFAIMIKARDPAVAAWSATAASRWRRLKLIA